MRKYKGEIGFAINETLRPGVVVDKIEERTYKGNIITTNVTNQTGEGVVDNLNMSMKISVMMNLYLRKNFQSIRYITYMGSRWKITNIDPTEHPRVILTIGGVYNGPTP